MSKRKASSSSRSGKRARLTTALVRATSAALGGSKRAGKSRTTRRYQRANTRTSGYVGMESKYFDTQVISVDDPITIQLTPWIVIPTTPSATALDLVTNQGQVVTAERVCTSLFAPEVGAGPQQYIGRKATMTQIMCNLEVALPGLSELVAFTGGPGQLIPTGIEPYTDYVVALVMDFQNNGSGTGPSWLDVFSPGQPGTEALTSQVNLANSHRFKVLDIKRGRINQQVAVSTEPTSTSFLWQTMPVQKRFFLNWKGRQEVQFTPVNDGTAASITDVAVYLMAIQSPNVTIPYNNAMPNGLVLRGGNRVRFGG